MKQFFTIVFGLAFIVSNAQQQEEVIIKTPKKPEGAYTKVFYSQKIINTKTVEVHRKGVMEFSIDHYFGDIAGDNGGKNSFFGLDAIKDVRLGFQVGLTDKLNLILSRAKGAGAITNQYELGLKYQLLRQIENDPSHPVSLTFFANEVISTMPSADSNAFENYFKDFNNRHSQVVQLLVARKFGKVSFQLNPIFVHTNYVLPYDDESIFALGGALRLPISKKIVLLADYYHPFRSQSAKDSFSVRKIDFYDPIGIGLEILTQGHVFHINFTNATEILENRLIRHTTSSWGEGEFRWAFTISRNFILFRSKK